MAKRRNAKLKNTTVVAESEQPMPLVGQALAAPIAAVDEPAPIEAALEILVASEAPSLADAANPAPEFPSVALATVAMDTPAGGEAAVTGTAVAVEGKSSEEPS